MLFKINDQTGKFVQYISCCIDQEDILGGAFSSIIVSCLRKTKNARLREIVYCHANTYSWSYAPLEISCFIEPFKYQFSLVEVPSTKRKASFKGNYWASDDSYSASTTVPSGYISYTYSNAGSTARTYTYNTSTTSTGSWMFTVGTGTTTRL